jgi:hypothetical protein
MEAASWLADEKWSSRPTSVHPAIAWVARWVNDTLDDAERQTLWPLIVASVDTRIRWHPLRSSRLRLAAIKARTSSRSDPIHVWQTVLNYHRELTGPVAQHQPIDRPVQLRSAP